MTTEKLNRMAELGYVHLTKNWTIMQEKEYYRLLEEWKLEQDAKFDARKLKRGDMVQSVVTGESFVIADYTEHGPVAVRCIILTVNDSKLWKQVNPV